MRSDWFCTYFNKTSLEYEMIKKYYINKELKISNIPENNYDNSNIKTIFYKTIQKRNNSNIYGFLNNFNYSNISKNKYIKPLDDNTSIEEIE
jgi:hypothetical protein